MSAPMALVCRLGSPGTPGALQWGPMAPRALQHGEVRVRVLASAVNPIDVKRASGYGRRMLSLLGAGGRTLVLGNDLTGVVMAVGPGVSHMAPGDRVWGLVPTGAQGAHRSEVCVAARWLRPLPMTLAPAAVAALPYTFTTLWRALRAVGLSADNAAGRRVLVNGAGGALGQLAIQLLTLWGAQVTAVCGAASAPRSLALGAVQVVDRHRTRLAELPATWDATLNFGAWADEVEVFSRLHERALGHATTVHPLLGEIDQQGWLLGGLACWRAWRAMRRHVGRLSPHARYSWTVFQPDAEALDALQASLLAQPMKLEVGLRTPFDEAEPAYAHVGRGQPTRAVLVAPTTPEKAPA